MVLRIRVNDPSFLRQAVGGILGEKVIIIWSPDFLGVQSVPKGEDAIVLLKIAPESFISYHSTDLHFNAVIQSSDLRYVFGIAKEYDHIEFSQSLEQHNNGFLFLNASFHRPVRNLMGDRFPMRIFGMLPGGAIDISYHIPLSPPVATFDAQPFFLAIHSFWPAVIVTVCDNQVFFTGTQSGSPLKRLIMCRRAGMISTREDCKTHPIDFYFHLPNLVGLIVGIMLSNEVSLFKNGANKILISYKLTDPLTHFKGELIHAFTEKTGATRIAFTETQTGTRIMGLAHSIRPSL